MCFAPQRRAIFADRNFKNGSDHEVFCTFWLTNVLRATAECHFCRSQLQKWLREWGVLYILTWKCASRHSGVPFFKSLLNSYLRTRRLSEATFRTSGTTNHWKNTAIRDVANIWRTWNFFLLTTHACWSSCYWLDCCATLLFNSPYCRKLDFQTSFDKFISLRKKGVSTVAASCFTKKQQKTCSNVNISPPNWTGHFPAASKVVSADDTPDMARWDCSHLAVFLALQIRFNREVGW